MATKRTTKPTEKPVAPVETSSPPVDVAARAYERFLARGGEHGHDVEDWLAAEAESAK